MALDETDIDYATKMIPHHQMAIDESNKVLATTKNDGIKSAASSIVASNTAAKEALQKELALHDVAKADEVEATDEKTVEKSIWAGDVLGLKYRPKKS